MAIALTGLGSGLDTASLIQQLLAGPRDIIAKTQTRVTETKTAQSALRDINSRLSNLLSRTRDLTPANFQLKKATSDTPSSSAPIVSVSAGSSAAIGSFAIRVDQLATATSITGTAASGQAINAGATLGSAGFSTTVTPGTFSVNGTQFTIDASTVLSDGVDAPASNTILAKINNAGIGVTASVTNDPDGRPNRLILTSGSAIQLGTGADTSNFLSAAKLLASPGTTTRTSTGNLGVASPSAALASARLDGALGGTSGSFTLNGVAITWDSAVDSVNDIISKVNASDAGVVMSYDPTTDRFKMVNKTTGSTAIALADTSGTLLQAMKLSSGSQALGSNAQYAVNGGATQYSTTNTVTDAVAGVAISLLAQSATTVNVTVANDVDAVTQKVQDWVNQYNSAVTLIRSNTAFVAGGDNGVLFGDSGINSILSTLTTKVTSTQAVSGSLNTLSAVGITFGAIGSAVGSTTTLQFDSAKFKAALANDPAAVGALFTANSGGSTGFAKDVETYVNALSKSDGMLANRITERDRQIKSLNDQITRLQSSLTNQQELLERKFQRMEEALTKLQAQQSTLASLQSLSS